MRWSGSRFEGTAIVTSDEITLDEVERISI